MFVHPLPVERNCHDLPARSLYSSMICSEGVDFRENFEKKKTVILFSKWPVRSASFDVSSFVENNAKESGTQGIGYEQNVLVIRP